MFRSDLEKFQTSNIPRDLSINGSNTCVISALQNTVYGVKNTDIVGIGINFNDYYTTFFVCGMCGGLQKLKQESKW